MPVGLLMVGGGMPQHMGRNFPAGQRRHAIGAALDKAVDAEPGEGFSMPADEDGIVNRAALHEFGQDLFGVRPQEAMARLSSFPVQGRKGMTVVGAAELQVTHSRACNTVSVSAG